MLEARLAQPWSLLAPHAPGCGGLLTISMPSPPSARLFSTSPLTPSGIYLSTLRLLEDVQLFHTPPLQQTVAFAGAT